ncbi:MAG: hypothetical protein NTY77_08750 [Elusimicrobia bacterium]|nr:hypothetical protein [Elusimicrobiota bacterium]
MSEFEIPTATQDLPAPGPKAIKVFYLLAPLWFLVEWLFWPGFRAGPVVGHSPLALLAFYAMETAIGAAYWAGSAYAEKIATLENLVYLTAIIIRVFLGPLRIFLAVNSSPAQADSMATEYVAAMPGELFSAAQLVFFVYRAWYGEALRAAFRGPPGPLRTRR